MSDELILSIRGELDRHRTIDSVEKQIERLNASKTSIKPLRLNVTVDKKLIKNEINNLIRGLNKETKDALIHKFSMKDDTKSVKKSLKDI